MEVRETTEMPGLALPHTEHMAIEMKYLGSTYAEISTCIGVSKRTIEDWFSTDGKLSLAYVEYMYEMARKQRELAAQSVPVADEEILRIIRKVVLRFNERLLSGKYNPTVSDFYRCWKMQRIMQGLPTNITETVCAKCRRRKLKIL